MSPADWIYQVLARSSIILSDSITILLNLLLWFGQQIDLVGQLIAKLDPDLDSEVKSTSYLLLFASPLLIVLLFQIHANACTALVGFVAPPVSEIELMKLYCYR